MAIAPARSNTAEGAVEYAAPRCARRRNPLSRVRAALSGRTQALKDLAVARDLVSGIRADYAVVAPSALACFDDDFEACVAHLRLPVTLGA